MGRTLRHGALRSAPVPAEAYDPTIYSGAAAHYLRGRPPYSREFAGTLAGALGLDGTHRLLDVGCGPGRLAVELAHLFAEVVALDPDREMLEEGQRFADRRGARNVRFVRGLARELPTLVAGPFRLVTFGQSIHWTDRERSAESAYDLLEPGGAIALIAHTVEGRPVPRQPAGTVPIPHDAIRAVIRRYLGPRSRAGRGFTPAPHPDRYEDVLARTRFGSSTTMFCPGRPDLVQDADRVLSNYHSTSFAAPHLFGARLDAFQDDVRAVLAEYGPDGRFWDWPGDTEVVIGRKAKR